MKNIISFLSVALVMTFAIAINFLVESISMTENIMLGAVTLTSGFRDSVLYHLKDIAKGSTPQLKLDPHGFLQMLYRFRKPEILGLNNSSGHRKTARVKYLQRFTVDFTDTAKSCDQTNQMAYQENTVDLSSTRQIAIHIPDETIARYNDEASRTVRLGQPSTDFMNEFMEQIMASANAILDGVSVDLLTTMSTSFGVNRRTGNANASTININSNMDTNVLNDGFTQILSDYAQNRERGRMQIVGNGLFHNWVLQNKMGVAGTNASGIDTRIQGNGFDFYYDLNTVNSWGADQIGVFAPDSVGIVEYMEYTGFKAGEKPGGSVFGTLPLPMQLDADNVPVMFDFQLKYYDCAETLTDAYYGTSLTVEKGYNLIISKQSGLYTIPDNAYRGTDVLNGNRGSYRYAITNSCESCA